MLILSRKTDASLIIGNDVKITIKKVHVRNQQVTFEINAPDEIEEVLSKMETTTIDELENNDVQL